MNEIAAAALFTVLADENVMIPAAKWGLCSSNYTRVQLKKIHCTVNTIYQVSKMYSGKEVLTPYLKYEYSITLTLFNMYLLQQ